MSVSNYGEDQLLGTVPSTVYVKLHLGDPGEAGTSNAATETTRQSATLGASSSGTRTASALPTWTNVSTSETYSHISLWDNVSAGNCWWTGALTASKAVTAGDTFTLDSLTVSLD